MIKQIIQVNQRVDLEAVVRGQREVYPSRIESFNEHGIVLAAPLRGGVLEPVRIGDTVKVTIATRDRLYAFETSVLNRQEGRIPYLIVEWPTELQTANRRAYFRLDVLLNMDYAILDPEDSSAELAVPANRGLVKNLSACGLLAWVDDESKLLHGSRLLIDIHCPRRQLALSLLGGAERANSRRPKASVAIGLEIEDISPTFQDQIIQYLFQQQRERRSKGIHERIALSGAVLMNY